MLAKLATELPLAPSPGVWLYEPKWDGFRVLVFKDAEAVHLQSRDGKPIARYFPELEAPLRRDLPERCVLDGEIVIVGPAGLDFDAMLLRIHPAVSRVERLASETPASVVLWDLLALGDLDLRGAPLSDRRARLEQVLASARPPVHLTPATLDPVVAADWFERFEGAGLDGVVCKRLDGTYEAGKRAMVKVKHTRTADCVVAGFRWHKNGPGTLVGSLLLGLYDAAGDLQHVGITAAFTTARRRALVEELEPYRSNAQQGHPWAGWTDWDEGPERRPGMTSRWNRDKDLRWEPLRPDLVCEVRYDHLQGRRFRHATQFLRWRPDKAPAACRYDQLDTTPPAELAALLR